MTNGSATGGGGRPYVNGNREQANNFLLDGMDNNQVSDNLVGLHAERGRHRGVQHDHSKRLRGIRQLSGRDHQHVHQVGDQRVSRRPVRVLPKRRAQRQQLGEQLERFAQAESCAGTCSARRSAGPIKKDKLFFFVDYQGQRLNFPTSTGRSRYSRRRNARATSRNAARQRDPVVQPLPVGCRAAIACHSPNNQIPVSLLDPVAKNLFASPMYPAAGQRGLKNNYFNTSASHIYADQGDAKIDYNLTSEGPADRAAIRRACSGNPSINSFPLSLLDSTNADLQRPRELDTDVQPEDGQRVRRRGELRAVEQRQRVRRSAGNIGQDLESRVGTTSGRACWH